ncbi:hypothetical protein HAX54_043183 [Datura stramonium]|uniref:Uncharacterized protein n=1 Tax=Datura stramonium TaxID=4076 RepID=A0ABS8SN60_DATST|nr:hypothetical protein [Datura stramonium]
MSKISPAAGLSQRVVLSHTRPMERVPTHGFPKKILLKKFYTGFDLLTRSMENNMASGCFMDKMCDSITTILDRIARHNQARHTGDHGGVSLLASPIYEPSYEGELGEILDDGNHEN